MSSDTKKDVTVNINENENKVENEETGISGYNDTWAIGLFFFIVITTLILSVDGFMKVWVHGRPDNVQSILKDINTKYSSVNITYDDINNNNNSTTMLDSYEIYEKIDKRSDDDDDIISFTGLIFAIFIYQLSIFIPLCISIFYYFLILKVWVVYAIMFGGFNFICFIIFRKWKSRVDFATVVLNAAAVVMKNYVATIFVGYFTSFFGAIWSFCIAFAIYGLVLDFTLDQIEGITGIFDSKYISAILIVYVSFSYLYIKSVIENLVHVTVAAVYALFIFSSVKKKDGTIKILVRDPTYDSLKRSLSTSFGTICYGSLIILMVEWTKRIIDIINKILTLSCCICCYCCFEYVISALDGLLEYFNQYAFVHVAIYGSSFKKASKESFLLMHKHGVDAVLNDVLVSRVMIVGKLTVIAISSFVTYQIITVAAKIENTTDILMHVVVAFSVSETVFSAVSSVLKSAVSTLFVGICNDIKSLKMTQPEFCDEIAKKNPKLIFGANESVSDYVDVGIAKVHNILDDLV
ncbi:hypothetical protein PIROE2DRAFT_59089 [Piromyces sp. E2]|nr:hypothetical protein PIROE2DRAFT_59089 [Piromyces sp. E2]|eukprot:OUM66918.1 hypothetical protein PIROE2DRAFT_59089 [Piromyces sp. E2]